MSRGFVLPADGPGLKRVPPDFRSQLWRKFNEERRRARRVRAAITTAVALCVVSIASVLLVVRGGDRNTMPPTVPVAQQPVPKPAPVDVAPAVQSAADAVAEKPAAKRAHKPAHREPEVTATITGDGIFKYPTATGPAGKPLPDCNDAQFARAAQSGTSPQPAPCGGRSPVVPGKRHRRP